MILFGSGTMNLLGVTRLILLVCGVVRRGTTSPIDLPDVIVGNPNQSENDVLGPAISEKELQGSLSLKINDTSDFKEDPIASSGFFEGDIMVDSEDHLLQILEGDPKGQLSAIKNPQLTWPKGVIPYVISASYTSQERAMIARAMAEYHQKTCIRFVPRTTHTDYIHILRGQGCSSTVGRARGVQVVSLGRGCVNFGVIIHILMHAAGFWHEQSRNDRDNYVTIYWNNIVSGLSYNFNKNSNTLSTDLGLPYDYSSIMHYGSYAFTRAYGSPTIVPKKSGVTIGQRNGFSSLDVKSLNLLYKCSGVQPGPTPKPEECTDNHHYCSSWATAGYCKANPEYMLVKCKKSCNACDTGTGSSCIDIARHCSSWSAQGECQRNPAYMKKNCKRACNFCGNTSCNDLNKYCQDWARKGECSKNSAYMQMFCQKACGIC